MNKFSLYDFLGIVLPGMILVFFAAVINKSFGIINIPRIGDKTIIAGVLLAASLFAGSLLYILGFVFTKKMKFIYKFTKTYIDVTTLYLQMGFLHSLMNKTLNAKANEWYSRDIFFDKETYDLLEVKEQKIINELQDEFYDRAYYEVEYIEKNSPSKSFHSLYLFFRHTFIASLLLLIALSILVALVMFKTIETQVHSSGIILLYLLFISILLLSIYMAKWLRKRMVMKLYWTYFTHLNINK